MEYTLDATNLSQSVNIPSTKFNVKVGTAGTWVGTVEVQYTINGSDRTYTGGVYTDNFDFVLEPLTDLTTFVFTRTSGSVELAVSLTRI
tara:strand:- start:729 stop:995 length:267 start_codon:yes stop_codon:yes gene_type:complete